MNSNINWNPHPWTAVSAPPQHCHTDNLTKEAAKPKVRQTSTKGKLLNFEEGPVRVSVLETQATKKNKSADGAT